MENQGKEISNIIESLSEIERKILPYLNLSFSEIQKKSGLDKVSIMRALQFLENKNIIKLKTLKTKIIDLDENGIIYKKNNLPERRLINFLAEKKEFYLKDSKKVAKIIKLSDNEFKAALGALKNKAMIEIKQGKINLATSLDLVSKKTLEEQLIEALPIQESKLTPEQLHAFNLLKSRKQIVKTDEKKQIKINITELGKKIMKSKLSTNLIEALTPEIIKQGGWKNKKFRKYDIKSKVPKIYGGKTHFVNQAIDRARKIWLELGFKEMSGNLIQSSFWNFDALFTAQDHPVRELQDTFYIKDVKIKLPDKKIVKRVKQAHESGISSSKGWQYSWNEAYATQPVLRTHTTCLSAQTLANLSKLKSKIKQGKFFSIGKCFRNETIDQSHLFEFNQTEGIVIHPQANFQHLLGYLKAFLNKMGFEKIRFRPHFFPYTEPSVEADVYDKESKKWIEILGAGIFRPEVVVPLLGKYVPVLAWGMGFDRLVTKNFSIKDLRELYKNNLTKLREIKFW